MNYFRFYFIALFIAISSILSSQVVINEYSASNLESFTDNYGSYEDWFELYNSGPGTVDLGGYYLSDNPGNLMKWQFPDGITISGQGFIKVWCTGRDEVTGSNYHTNFRLTQTKENPEYLTLSNSLGEIVDSVQLVITRKEHSRGRTPDGNANWSIFIDATPGASNNSSTAYTKYADKPQMSLPAGFYDDPILTSITTTQPNSEIHYTIDGSLPISTSPLYTDPISVTTTTIVKAVTICADPDVAYSLIEFNTYFINDEHTMAIMSTSAGQLDNLLNGNQSLRPFGTFEYFNKEGERTNIGYGEFNEHGQDSWVHDQRSIDYISRDECGYNYAIREPLIPLTDRDEFQRIILRAAGDDNYPGIDTSALLRDFFVQNTAQREGLNLDVRKGEKGLLYVNGIYWGIYGFREKVNDHDFTDYYYNQGKYDIYFLMLWGGSWAEYGGQAAWNDWNDLHDFIKYNDMSVQSNYEYVKTRLDYTSLVDYILINSYVVCSDWINWNVGWWRGTNPEGGHQKWGYVLWDEDATFAHYINYTGVPGISPYTSPCYPEGLTSDPEEHIVMLNHLLDNEEFRTYYINRYIDLYNTAFNAERMIGYLNSIEEIMTPEIPDHVARWGGSLSQWQFNVQKIKNFISARHAYLPGGLNSCYDLDGPYEVNFAISPPQAGIMKINSLTMEESSWGGYYFGGINTKLEAIESSPDFVFDHWELYNHSVSPYDTLKQVTLQFVTGDLITAVFQQVNLIDSLVINEINYNSDGNFDSKDWVEFYNPQSYTMDISGWEFKDSDDAHVFEFPPNTTIEPNGYLVLSRDTATFSSFYPDVENLVGDLDFGLSSNGELIRLFDSTGVMIDTVNYGVDTPWPPEPNGSGPSLELKFWEYDNALPESWVASNGNGTPGEINGYTVNINESEILQQELSFVIYPNPMMDEAILQVTSAQKLAGYTLTIYNVLGSKAKEYTNLKGDRIILDKKGLEKGIHICILTDKYNQVHGQKKLIVK
ncbi:MAG: lamin tail domain-containing protein [Bacteroidales bacterium]|nr:lamin tail domain-containing protein [Bacteroidales bacterium]MCF8403793.1 lamin tail domain-containing protein [Bacteroidales bacterium]